MRILEELDQLVETSDKASISMIKGFVRNFELSHRELYKSINKKIDFRLQILESEETLYVKFNEIIFSTNKT